MQAAVTRFREMNQNTAISVVLLELKFMPFRSLSKDALAGWGATESGVQITKSYSAGPAVTGYWRPLN